ncbi:MAG: hypothetical protein ACR2IH_05655, partial [Pyrinomonadaceae bacterium]
DLETVWDNAQAALQPMNPDTWTEMDNAIDHVLKQVRSPGADASAAAPLQALINIIDNLGKKHALPTKAAAALPANSQARSPIGDLSPFRDIANEMLQFSIKGDAAATKARATSLETAWDTAQPKLQSANPQQWTELDTAIDAVLKDARSGNPLGSDTRRALENLISLIDASR